MNGIRERLEDSEKVLVGLGGEWRGVSYEKMKELLQGRDYFIVTTVTDGKILESGLDPAKIVAPCGNETWRQCSKSCTKDIWEMGEVPDGLCPHCKAPLTGNTIKADQYIEEGYLPQWSVYTKWLTGTLNKKLVILELGVGFQTPTVVRWPFEKTAFFNQKSYMYRINEKFSQITEELKGRAEGIAENSVEFINKLQ
ncbi:hypothetical protein C0033_10595 [Clostridium sp. chh4-2]|uniref:hypothetical protein n=1 Tax=Clostridium sp. chh4-2 TaxID=2067550 RepID=UPI000CCE6ED4|nr:hypothetical protein [Clostridium sp. chh4-2]PNV62094.1 hypothetical protein C0033_10595 [Clostridium sp. chh4-2]